MEEAGGGGDAFDMSNLVDRKQAAVASMQAVMPGTQAPLCGKAAAAAAAAFLSCYLLFFSVKRR
eukprot:1145179-Pelagomonas_calceolata.AAC.2